VSGQESEAGRVQARCSGCAWRVSVETLAQLREAAMRHDDSPRTRHIVTLDPPRRWPEDDEDFRALIAPARGLPRFSCCGVTVLERHLPACPLGPG
jgi:hypothetical protein